jgi:Ubiquitin interaction motif
VLQDLNQANEAAFDDQLFVGDVEGLKKLKTELKKSVSSQGGNSVQVLVSGIREARDRLQQKEQKEGMKEEEEEEERELYTAEEMDDPDIQLAIAMSLQDEGGELFNLSYNFMVLFEVVRGCFIQ